jgi:hypothetical protein
MLTIENKHIAFFVQVSIIHSCWQNLAGNHVITSERYKVQIFLFPPSFDKNTHRIEMES